MIFTSSSITSVIPQYPVCGLFLPSPKFGVILILAENFDPSFLIKFVLVLCSPDSLASLSHPKTFCKTISPGEKIETLLIPTNSSDGYPKTFSAPSFMFVIKPSISQIITLFIFFFLEFSNVHPESLK